jgi:uncharacterized protein YggT (Ycf19 family)
VTPQILGIVFGVLRFYEVLIIAWAIMSWFPLSGFLYEIFRVIGSVVEPYVGIFRRIIPPVSGFDFSPIIAILVLYFVMVILAQLA